MKQIQIRHLCSLTRGRNPREEEIRSIYNVRPEEHSPSFSVIFKCWRTMCNDYHWWVKYNLVTAFPGFFIRIIWLLIKNKDSSEPFQINNSESSGEVPQNLRTEAHGILWVKIIWEIVLEYSLFTISHSKPHFVLLTNNFWWSRHDNPDA